MYKFSVQEFNVTNNITNTNFLFIHKSTDSIINEISIQTYFVNKYF